MDLPDEIYVVVLENDLCANAAKVYKNHVQSPIVVETMVDLASKEHAKIIASRFNSYDHGEIRIGRVVFDD